MEEDARPAATEGEWKEAGTRRGRPSTTTITTFISMESSHDDDLGSLSLAELFSRALAAASEANDQPTNDDDTQVCRPSRLALYRSLPYRLQSALWLTQIVYLLSSPSPSFAPRTTVSCLPSGSFAPGASSPPTSSSKT